VVEGVSALAVPAIIFLSVLPWLILGAVETKRKP
jgi:hypothetical protein